ncbi:MAG: cytochrome ubiquinol oxidase subunit I, partial [Thermomicrobiaceae bacterium]|nr:cytochrome ubiquinol oxidase subunit I [Thermomicrobiaceae bacterium]
VPTVEARDEFWHEKQAGAATSGAAKAAPNRAIAMPSPSPFPLLAAGGLALAAGGMIAAVWPLAGLGLALLTVSLVGWALEPGVSPSPTPAAGQPARPHRV